MNRAAQIRIGISGWTYSPWRGVFYPNDLPHKRELEYAAQCLNSIEINGSFYSVQRPTIYRTWYEHTPDARHLLNQQPRPRKSRDVFVYFDNDVKVKAPFDAMALAKKLSLNRN